MEYVKTKICKICKEEKLLSGFSGKHSYCKPCANEYTKNHSKINADKIRLQRKDFRERNKVRLSEKSKTNYSSLTPEEKTERNLAKKHIEVNCSTCSTQFVKRKDTIKEWSGLCISCVQLKVGKRPEVISIRRINGIALFAKNGKLPIPKIENRRRGATHPNWGVSLKGELAHNWQGGKTPENERIRHSLEYLQWREAVFTRDNFTCTFCGDDKGGNLNADHIQPFALFKELRLSVENGRTLCEPCHDKYGAKVGNGVITRAAKFNNNATVWVSA